MTRSTSGSDQVQITKDAVYCIEIKMLISVQIKMMQHKLKTFPYKYQFIVFYVANLCIQNVFYKINVDFKVFLLLK